MPIHREAFAELCRSVESHNQPHKYLDPKINLSELRQILCETIGPTLILGGGVGGREDSGDFSLLENHTFCK